VDYAFWHLVFREVNEKPEPLTVLPSHGVVVEGQDVSHSRHIARIVTGPTPEPGEQIF
jgi:hypothetical protein